MHCVNSPVGKSSCKLSTTILRKLSKYKTCEICKTSLEWSWMFWDVTPCCLLGLLPTYWKSPQHPHLSPQSNIHLHGRKRRQQVLLIYQHICNRQHSSTSEKILILKHKLHQILKHKQLLATKKYGTCSPSTETLMPTNMSRPKYCHANFTLTCTHGLFDWHDYLYLKKYKITMVLSSTYQRNWTVFSNEVKEIKHMQLLQKRETWAASIA